MSNNQNIALVALTQNGVALGSRLQEILPGARVYGLARRCEGVDVAFDDVGELLRNLFDEGIAIIGLCASGVLIRILAPLLEEKRDEPPVLALAEDGSVVVPLLGGHHGANRLARQVAQALGGVAAITTAGDVRLGFGLDDPPAGWIIRNPALAKSLTAAMLAGEPVRLEVETGDAAWLTRGKAGFSEDGVWRILVTDRDEPGDGSKLVLHPPTLAMGLGCERGAAPAELLALARQSLADHGLAAASVATVVSLDLKADEAAVHDVAEAFGVEARFFDAETLEAQTPRLANPSAVVFAAVGCHGVAEGAALAAAKPDGALAVVKQRSARGTCAIARAPWGVAPKTGAPRGRLFIAGTGPGAAAFRSPAVDRALAQITDIVGYGPYMDLLGRAAEGKRQHRFDLGEEEKRCRTALDLAGAGRAVMLLSSGDPGIYALATLVFELLDREDNSRWNRVALDVIPGISAMQMAAARAGAPLGHDFCAISLSDLLTPWPTVMQRLEAACTADLVIALYNPTSRTRGHRFAEALALLQRQRAPDTPVVVARNLARSGENVRILTLAKIDAAEVDMLTTIVVGSSQSRMSHRGGRKWMYTPRGYGVSESAKRVQCQ